MADGRRTPAAAPMSHNRPALSMLFRPRRQLTFVIQKKQLVASQPFENAPKSCILPNRPPLQEPPKMLDNNKGPSGNRNGPAAQSAPAISEFEKSLEVDR
jgi:hypothetical protein